MIRRAGNVKLAIQSIRTARWRSFLTMLGVIIGVVSVVTIVSLGEGVKQQIRQQGLHRGKDLLTILPGQRVERNETGDITGVNPFPASGTTFTEADYRALETLPEIDDIAPVAGVTGTASRGDTAYDARVIATSSSVPELLNQKIAYGSFFSDLELNEEYAVIGTRVAERLFGENVPIGKSFQLRERTFVVHGIFEEFPPAGPLSFNPDYNNGIFIPYEIGRELMGGNILIQELLAKPTAAVSVDTAASAVHQRLLELHAGQEDFTVLTPDEQLAAASRLLDMLTATISGIAAISLIVGGIGIMNIMFVSVTERTNEIGIRKAVGATTRQIMNQFLTEAVILASVGGIIGVLLSVLINFLLRVLTDLQPVITLPIMGLAVLVSLLVGMVFGVTPALRAARKDPIEALRYQ